MQYLLALFPITGLFMFAGGLLLRRRLQAKAEGCIRVWGTVVGNVKGAAGGLDPAPVYRPVAEFHVGTQRFSFTGEAGYGKPLQEGTKIAVLYNPLNPLIAFIQQDHYTPANMLLGIGGAFVGLSALAAWSIWYSGR